MIDHFWIKHTRVLITHTIKDCDYYKKPLHITPDGCVLTNQVMTYAMDQLHLHRNTYQRMFTISAHLA